MSIQYTINTPLGIMKYTIVLDLDHTLIHATRTPVEHILHAGTIEAEEGIYYVYIRPGARYLLRTLAEHHTVGIWTKSKSYYANQAVEIFGHKEYISFLYTMDFPPPGCKWGTEGKPLCHIEDIYGGVPAFIIDDDSANCEQDKSILIRPFVAWESVDIERETTVILNTIFNVRSLIIQYQMRQNKLIT